MPGKTKHLGLGYFNYGDKLSDFATDVEISRFQLLDSQIFGLMSIFGNGVIEGWTVSVEDSFTISISPGFGNINFTAARTEFPNSLEDIIPNSIIYVYAKTKERTRYSEDIDFFVSPNKDLTDPHYILLAEVITGALSIEKIDNTVRREIQFLELIKAAIKSHRHRGGSLNPSKIDLASEVKGQLPAYRIEDFDTEKITSGILDLERMPLLDHQDLGNVGLLTHPQLDTFVKTLETSNKELFGEISTTNLLQLLLAMKYIYDDSSSPFYLSNRTVDKNMINELIVIPGITNNSFIDFANTTADINLTDHYVSGKRGVSGTSFYVTYDTDLAWNSSFSKNNVVVSNDTVMLAFDNQNEKNILNIESFENSTSDQESLTSGSNIIFKKETLITADTADIISTSTDTNVLEGFYAGKFSHKQKFRVQYKKEFAESKDWSTYDSFVINVKCLDQIHGAVKIFFYKDDNTKSQDYVLLDENYVTHSSDPSSNGYENRVISMSTFSFTNSVKGFVIYSDDTENTFNFYVDYITIQRALLLPEEGILTLRYSTNNTVYFSSILWDSTEPSETEIKIRTRVANNSILLSRSDFTNYINSGSSLGLQGTDIEIEIHFLPDTQRITTPILNRLRILVVTNAEIDGFLINTTEEFSRGTTSNAAISSGPTQISLQTPVYAESYYFCSGNSINQIHEESMSDGSLYTKAELAIFGQNLPISPNQIFAAVEQNLPRLNLSKLFEPRCVQRQDGRTFVIADTFNDRIIEVSEDGTLLSGFGSINYEHSDKTFPLAAALDTRTNILYVVWSRKISFKTVNISKITVQSSTQDIQLIENYDKIMGLSTDELQTVSAEGQIMQIYLSLQNAGLIKNLTGDKYCFVSADAIATGIGNDSVFYSTISTPIGIPLFVGNFAYIDGIFCPTYANKTTDESYVVANASVAIADYKFPITVTEVISKTSTTASVVEVDKNNTIIFASNTMLFSPFVPGRVEKIKANTFLVGGIKPIAPSTTTTTTENTITFRAIDGDDNEKNTKKSTLNDFFFGSKESPYSGSVIILDTVSQATTFQYSSPSGLVVADVDIDPTDGLYTIAESSFKKSGRIIKVDSTGNIVFVFGEGTFSTINSVRVNNDGSMVIST